jgi:hypothetical protein
VGKLAHQEIRMLLPALQFQGRSAESLYHGVRLNQRRFDWFNMFAKPDFPCCN